MASKSDWQEWRRFGAGVGRAQLQIRIERVFNVKQRHFYVNIMRNH